MIQFNKENSARGRVRMLAAGFALAAVMSAGTMLAGTAHAGQTFTVNNVGDPIEGEPNFGVCNANLCTLRTAITVANNTPGKDTIDFSIPRAGVQSIRPTEPLPALTDPVVIDGYTQFGAEPNTRPVGNDAQLLIEIDGVNAGAAATGLRIEADDVTVRGLVIQRFGDAGVSINGDVNKVEGNFIGTDPTGRGVGPGNGDEGVSIFGGERNTVGGNSPAARNHISGNEGAGVSIFGSSLGTKANRVQNNYIGTDKFGTGPLGNGFNGVFILDSTGNAIGGGQAEANVISFNKGDGVALRSVNTIFADSGNAIRSNSIYQNEDLGIDLHQDGPTANDPGDPDAGENDLQNKPAVTSAVTANGTTTVKGKLNSTPDETFQIEFFSNPSGDEGKKLLDQRFVTTNANGDATYIFTTSKALAAGQRITATATDAGRNTSEFSAPRTVVAR